MSKTVSLDTAKLLKEEYKPIVGYEGLYEVSNHGNVVSLITDMTLKKFNKGRDKNYWAVSLRSSPSPELPSVDELEKVRRFFRVRFVEE